MEELENIKKEIAGEIIEINESLKIRKLAQREYSQVFELMKKFNQYRAHDDNEIWTLEHFPVFTQGLAGKAEHLLNTGNIPVIQTDRGGQVSYHGPGQAVIYLLLSMKKYELGIRQLVSMIENTTIKMLARLNISAHARADAPGVYVEDGRKIASLGLKISRNYSYHGVAINVDMDLEPFSRINPCGLIGMKMAQISEWQKLSVNEVFNLWTKEFINSLISKPSD